jgi:hypothetical protein
VTARLGAVNALATEARAMMAMRRDRDLIMALVKIGEGWKEEERRRGKMKNESLISYL